MRGANRRRDLAYARAVLRRQEHRQAENEDEEEGILFLTQKQLNQVLLNKDIDLKVQDDRWFLNKPLTKDQTKKVGLVGVNAEYMGNAGDFKCYEAVSIS